MNLTALHRTERALLPATAHVAGMSFSMLATHGEARNMVLHKRLCAAHHCITKERKMMKKEIKPSRDKVTYALREPKPRRLSAAVLERRSRYAIR